MNVEVNLCSISSGMLFKCKKCSDFSFMKHVFTFIALVSFQKEFLELWVTNKWHQATVSLRVAQFTHSSHLPASKLEWQ